MQGWDTKQRLRNIARLQLSASIGPAESLRLRTLEKEPSVKRWHKAAAGVVAALSLGVAAAVLAHPGQMGGGMGPAMKGGMGHGRMAGAEMQKRAKEKGITLPQHRAPGFSMMQGMGPGMMGGAMAGRVQHDGAFAADMHLVRDMLFSHDRIRRTVTNLPNGIKTVTESDDPQVAQAIQTHVASMVQRLSDGKEFNLFSKTIPVLFDNRDKIETTVETTAKGSVVTQTSADAKVVTALQEHATEVDELVREGMAAMMRNMRASMGGGAAHR
jgi:hypothetical protein